MLSDSERKILRILWNMYKMDWIRPDVGRICRLSGRTIEELRAIVKALAQKGYVEVRKGEMRVIRGWEPEAPKLPRWIPMD